MSDQPNHMKVKIALKYTYKLAEEILTLTCVNSSENTWVKFEIPFSKMMGVVGCGMELVIDKDFPVQTGSLTIIEAPVFIPDVIQTPPNVVDSLFEGDRSKKSDIQTQPLKKSGYVQ